MSKEEKTKADLILEKLEAMSKEIVDMKAKTGLTEHSHAEKAPVKPAPHLTIDEIDNCPECHKEFHVDEFKEKVKAAAIAEAKPQILKEIAEKAKGKHHCATCGLKVLDSEPNCPLCGGKKLE